MQTVTLNGKEFKLSFNMAAAISYERMTGNSFFGDIEKFESGKIEPLANIGYAMIAANNDTIHVPEFDEFTQGMVLGQEASDFFTAVSNEIVTALTPAKGDRKPAKKGKGKKTGEDDKGEEQKND